MIEDFEYQIIRARKLGKDLAQKHGLKFLSSRRIGDKEILRLQNRKDGSNFVNVVIAHDAHLDTVDYAVSTHRSNSVLMQHKRYNFPNFRREFGTQVRKFANQRTHTMKTAAGIQISIRELPDTLKKALRQVGKAGGDVRVVPATRVSPDLTSAGEGRRNFLAAVNLATGKVKVLQGAWGGGSGSVPRDSDSMSREFPVPEGFAVLQGTSGYKGIYVVIYVNPANFSNFSLDQASGASELSEKALLSLKYFKEFNSAGRKREFEEHNLGPYNPSNPIVQELVAAGLLKATARSMKITTQGKNLADKERSKIYKLEGKFSRFASSSTTSSLVDNMVRVASELPKGSEARREILAAVGEEVVSVPTVKKKAGDSDYTTILEGKKIRLQSWNRGGHWDITLTELPQKPLEGGRRKMRIAKFAQGVGNVPQYFDVFIRGNILQAAKVSKTDSFDSAYGKIRKAYDAADKVFLKKWEETDDPRLERFKGKDMSMWLPKHRTSDINYLQVRPADMTPFKVQGKDFGGEVSWDGFKFYSPSSDFQSHDPTYSYITPTAAASARKFYKMMRAKPTVLKGVSYNELDQWFVKNKIKTRTHNSVAR